MTRVESLDEIPCMAEDVRVGWLETVYDTDPDGIPLPSYPAEAEGVSLNEYAAMLLAQGEARGRRERRSSAPGSAVEKPQAAAV